MNNYRILERAGQFKAQWRFLWIFWADCVIPVAALKGVRLRIFNSFEEAEGWIALMEADECARQKAWRVVHRKHWSPL